MLNASACIHLSRLYSFSKELPSGNFPDTWITSTDTGTTYRSLCYFTRNSDRQIKNFIIRSYHGRFVFFVFFMPSSPERRGRAFKILTLSIHLSVQEFCSSHISKSIWGRVVKHSRTVGQHDLCSWAPGVSLLLAFLSKNFYIGNNIFFSLNGLSSNMDTKTLWTRPSARSN